MSVQTQKEAVFNAVSSVLAESNVAVNEGEDYSTHLNRELRAQITSILVEGFTAGNIALEKPFESDSARRTYCSGLTSNWLRKDKRLNGNVAYQPKNPGSRSGSTDAQVKAMRLLLSTKTDATERAEIQAFIDKRLAEIKPATVGKQLTAEQIAVLEAAGLGHLT